MRFPLYRMILAGLLGTALHAQEKNFRTGDVILRDAFSDLAGWTTTERTQFREASPANILNVETPAYTDSRGASELMSQRDAFGNAAKTEKKHIAARRDVTAELKPYAGYEIELKIEMKADRVPLPDSPWEGVRFLLRCYSPTSGFGAAANDISGTFDWKTVAFRTRLPTDLTRAVLFLGLVSNTGNVQFRRLEIKTVGPPRKAYYGSIKGVPHKGHDLPRLRGFNRCLLRKNSEMTGFWKANVLKYWMHLPDLSLPESEISAEVERHLNACDRSLPQIAEAGAYLVFQAAFSKKHGRDGRTKSDCIYIRPGDADRFVKVWEQIARHYKGNKTIWGFELINESVLRIPAPKPGCPDYETLMERTARAINKIDPERTIIIQPEEWNGMNAFYRLRPIKAANIVYAVHFYVPFALTHQNLFKETGPDVAYPGNIKGTEWNREMLRRAMEPAVEFQRAYNVHMFVSEFSCIRWAPGAERWLDDSISLFEELGWDWMYHDIYAWPGWNPEFGSDRNSNQRDLDNPRALVLRKWMAKNRFLNGR